jgi:uncharacterized membrane protein
MKKNLILLTTGLTIFLAVACSKSDTTTPPGGGNNAGPLFTAVKAIVTGECVNCHGSSSPNGNTSLATDADIVAKKDRIKARAVDGIGGFMPQGRQLAAAQKTAITNWINAGGRITD